MKKSVLKLFYYLLPAIALPIQAQYTVTNGGFESWTGDNPDSWIKSFETDAEKPFTKTTDKHSGSFALQLLNGAGEGRGAELSIPKTGTTLPQKLKGFVKYNIAAGQRARITAHLSKTRGNTTSSTTINEPAGWASFTGTSSDYTAFEINLDYRLVKQLDYLSNGGIDFDKILITIDSYGPATKDESMFSDIEDPEILNNTFINIDDLAFEGTVANEKFEDNSAYIPDNFEEWVSMDGKYLPLKWILSGHNASLNEHARIVSRSTDAKTGTYALNVKLAGDDTDYSSLLALAVTSGQKKLNFSAKGTMGTNDSISIAILDLASDDDTPAALKVVTGAELTSAYHTFSLDISKLTVGKLYLMFVTFTRASGGTYSVLLDDLNIDGVSAVSDLTYLDGIQITPNPCQGKFMLSGAATEKIVMYNAFGREVEAPVINRGADLEVDLSNQENGMYFVNINNAKTIKVIKE